MLKILVDGLRSEEDYKLYRRRDVFKSVMAFYESSLADQQTKVNSSSVQLCRRRSLNSLILPIMESDFFEMCT